MRVSLKYDSFPFLVWKRVEGRWKGFLDLPLDQKEVLWQEAKRLEDRENRGVERGEAPLAGV